MPIVLSLAALVAISAPGFSARETAEPLPVLDSGVALADFGGRQTTVSFSITRLGPRVSLQPLASVMGGELVLGPLAQRHELSFGGTSYLFGPEAVTLTSGEEIWHLSQPPVPGPHGLEVPLDLLAQTYGRILGYDFVWQAAERRLEVSRRAARELAVTFDLVNLQGVSTLVFQFPEEPRYRIERSPSRVEIELLGDRIAPGSEAPRVRDGLVRNVRFTPAKIVVDLAPETVAQDYVLESPFRLVFDVVRDLGGGSQRARRGGGTGPAAPAAPPRRQRSRSARIRTIVLDPGHGGSDTGAKGKSGVMEKDLTLELARLLRQELRARLPVRVVMTREADVDLDLDDRSALANQYKADLFISLHLNSSYDGSAHGAETYFSSLEASDERAAAAAKAENRGDPLFDLQLILWDLAQSHHLAESQRFASLVQSELNQELSLRNRGVKQAPFRVLLGAAMPAVLVEFGFLSNPREETRLGDPAYQGQLVQALSRSISRYRAQVEGVPVEPSEAALR